VCKSHSLIQEAFLILKVNQMNDHISAISILVGSGILAFLFGFLIGQTGKNAIRAELTLQTIRRKAIFEDFLAKDVELLAAQEKLARLTDRDAKGRFVKKEA